MKRIVLSIGALLILWVIPLYVRSFSESKGYLTGAVAAESAGHSEDAANFYAKAISWRVPGNFYSSDAETRLLALARATPTGPQKLESYLKLRSALMSSRSFIHPVVQHAIDEEIIAIAPQALSTIIKDEYEPKDRFGMHLLIQICFWGWILSAFGAIWKGFDEGGAVRKPALGKFAVSFFCFFAAWAFSLSS